MIMLYVKLLIYWKCYFDFCINSWVAGLYFRLFCDLGSRSIEWFSDHWWLCCWASSLNSKHAHFNSFFWTAPHLIIYKKKFIFFIINIIFSSYVLAFKLWNFISACRLTLCCQEDRSGFSAKLNSFYFIVCYETAAETRKMPSHHWAWGVQKRQGNKWL